MNIELQNTKQLASPRHIARSIVLQVLFEIDFNPGFEKDPEKIIEILNRNVAEFSPDQKDNPFLLSLVQLVLEKRILVDQIIQKAAPDWPLEKIGAVDRNILRLGLTELLFGNYDDVPPKVAINEAIELAKTFGGESSGRFINGVLATVYDEIGNPRKEEISIRQKNKTSTDKDMYPVLEKAGAVIFSKRGGKYYLAMIFDMFGYWTLPKGGVHEGETTKEAAAREIKEEIGITATITDEVVGSADYLANDPDSGRVRKQVTYLLGVSDFTDLIVEKKNEGIKEAKWILVEDIPELRIYEDIKQTINQAIEVLKQHA
jgi:transcription antitermination protein NusB